MWKRASSLVFFLLLKGHQGQGCSDTTENVTVVSGKPLCLWPNDTWTENLSSDWKKLNPQSGSFTLIGDEFKGQICPDFDRKNLNKILSQDNLTLTIKSPGPQDSGRYVLEMTNNNGTLCTKKFNVTILDPVEKPYLQGEWKALADGTCQVSLYCLVTRDNNVTYALYRGSTWIATKRNFTFLEKETNVTGLFTYTCNVSNEVSWESHTLNFTQGCPSVTPTYGFLPFLVVIIILVVLFLGALFICMWDKKRRQSQPDPKEFLTVYEDVKGQSRSLSAGLENESGQRELDSMEQMQEQKPPGEVATIYAMIQRQPSASTPRETSTLYSVIQPFKKHGSKKSNHSPSFNCTVYEEVGKKHFNAYNPARLSCKELENFEVYF